MDLGRIDVLTCAFHGPTLVLAPATCHLPKASRATPCLSVVNLPR